MKQSFDRNTDRNIIKAKQISISNDCLSYNNYGDIEDSVVAQALPQGYRSPRDVASALNVSTITVLRMCKSGKLAAVPVVRRGMPSYNIPDFAVTQLLLNKQAEEKKAVTKYTETQDKVTRPKLGFSKSHADFIEPWLTFCHKGGQTGKPFSDRTITEYRYYVTDVVNKYKVVNADTVEKALMRVDRDKFATKEKMYRACVCFIKYLIRKKQLTNNVLEDVRFLLPKNHMPVKRDSLNAAQAKLLLEAPVKLKTKALIYTLLKTGIRASEAASLKVEDVKLEERILIVQHGKGGKRRKVGIGNSLYTVLKEYIEKEQPDKWFFPNAKGKKCGKDSVNSYVRRAGKKINLPVHAHMLRRSFVTLNANLGRSLVMLQKSCGHDNIQTTRMYCQTTEEETIAAMQEWD